MSREEYRKSVWGGFFTDNVKKYMKTNNVGDIETYHKKLILKYKNEVRLMPDAKAVLKAIKNKKIKIGLVTNTLRSQTLHKNENNFNICIQTLRFLFTVQASYSSLRFAVFIQISSFFSFLSEKYPVIKSIFYASK